MYFNTHIYLNKLIYNNHLIDNIRFLFKWSILKSEIFKNVKTQNFYSISEDIYENYIYK